MTRPTLTCASCGDPCEPLHSDDLTLLGVESPVPLVGQVDGLPRCRDCYLELAIGKLPKIVRSLPMARDLARRPSIAVKLGSKIDKPSDATRRGRKRKEVS